MDSLSLQLLDLGGVTAFDGPMRTIRCFRDNALVKAVLANKAVVPVTPEAKFGYRSYRFFPWASRIAARQKLTK